MTVPHYIPGGGDSVKKLCTIDANTLQSVDYEPISFLVEDLLPPGLHLLAGAPKIGKSWLALWLCLQVAQGKPLWNFSTRPCEVLYLCLEDSFQRIQSRLFDLTEDAPSTLHFAVMSEQLHNGLVDQMEQFLQEHPATGLAVIDTLQRIRSTGNEANPYANDYRDIGVLKALADRYRIGVLLVHHLRKMNDDDPMNMISGTTGLSGATDSNFVLRKSKRGENKGCHHHAPARRQENASPAAAKENRPRSQGGRSRRRPNLAANDVNIFLWIEENIGEELTAHCTWK